MRLFFPDFGLEDMKLFKKKIMLNEDSLVWEQGLNDGDCLTLRLRKSNFPGEPANWERWEFFNN